MKRSGELSQLLRSIDRKSYPAYKSLAGSYDFNDYILSIDHVQGDPFASPSRLSILVPARKAAFPMQLLDQPYKRTAAADYVLRAFSRAIGRFAFKAGGSGKSGLIGVTRPGQEVLSRTACEFTKDGLLVRFEVGFPAAGRTVLAGELEKILFDYLPKCAASALRYPALPSGEVEQAVFLSEDQQYIRKQLDSLGEKILFDYLPKCAASALRYPALPSGEVEQAVFLSEDQQYIRKQLDSLGLCAFVADGSVLPRESGISDRPMEKAVPFSSPDSLAVTLTLPHRGQLRGMGICKGITLIAGGGYHGKSTLLKALERGVYDHIVGDGREFVITDATAMKLRAEDGRKITNADISLFINDLPNKTDTHRFCTLDASGSTSQAAAIVEGIEAGSRLFLIDEDTSATNFMVRDALMEEVVSKNHEPITPFLERARDLYEKAGISTILVVGSCGSYFYVADTVLQMDGYRAFDITDNFLERARDLYEKAGISTILVVGSCGSYFYVADTVLQMDGYRAFDITDNVTQVLKKHGEHRFCADNFCLPATDRILPLTKKNTGKNPAENNQRFSGKGQVLKKHGEHRFCADNFCLPATDRILPLTKKNTGKNPAENNQRFSGKGRFDKDRSGGRPHKEHEHAKVKTLGKTSFMIDRDTLDLRYVEQLVDSEQTAALSYLLRYAKEHFAGSGITLTALVDQLDRDTLDLRYVEQLVDSEQTAALSYLLRYAKEHFAGSGITLTALVDQLEALLDTKGLASICDSSYVPVGLSRPRRQEIFACFNRY